MTNWVECEVCGESEVLLIAGEQAIACSVCGSIVEDNRETEPEVWDDALPAYLQAIGDYPRSNTYSDFELPGWDSFGYDAA